MVKNSYKSNKKQKKKEKLSKSSTYQSFREFIWEYKTALIILSAVVFVIYLKVAEETISSSGK